MRRLLAWIAVVSLAGCTAVSSQKAQPVKADNLQFKNLQVLSPNITHDELVATMRAYSRSLGTRCEHCHVQVATEPHEQMDFASDAKPEKKVARAMMRMTMTANRDFLAGVNAHGQTVTCATCHRGHTVPEQWAPPPPPERRPEGAAPSQPSGQPAQPHP